MKPVLEEELLKRELKMHSHRILTHLSGHLLSVTETAEKNLKGTPVSRLTRNSRLRQALKKQGIHSLHDLRSFPSSRDWTSILQEGKQHGATLNDFALFSKTVARKLNALKIMKLKRPNISDGEYGDEDSFYG
ncbi:MAG TPA: hypothetical protein VI874_01515 [Candidatus Norongarragalinales archaeon]|nr:hypothetical protein [Candidatus Norongarragalinales archaeon]